MADDPAGILVSFRHAEAGLRRDHSEGREDLQVSIHDVVGRSLDQFEVQRGGEHPRQVAESSLVRDDAAEFMADHADKAKPPRNSRQERRQNAAPHALQVENDVEL